MEFLFLIATYLVCSTPCGLIVTKLFKNKDIRDFGSKNIGATNVTRVAGKKLGLLTLILDGAKGAIMILLCHRLFSPIIVDIDQLENLLLLTAAIAIIGHIYPIYLKFNGGKGVAIAIASLLALNPVVGSAVALTWVITFLLYRISSLSALVAFFALIPIAYFFGDSTKQIIFDIFVFFLIAFRHKENIVRLLKGEEAKLSKKKPKSED